MPFLMLPIAHLAFSEMSYVMAAKLLLLAMFFSTKCLGAV